MKLCGLLALVSNLVRLAGRNEGEATWKELVLLACNLYRQSTFNDEECCFSIAIRLWVIAPATRFNFDYSL